MKAMGNETTVLIGLGDKGHGKGWGTQCFLLLLLEWFVFRNHRPLRLDGRLGERKPYPWYGKSQAVECLKKLDMHKSMEHDSYENTVLAVLSEFTSVTKYDIIRYIFSISCSSYLIWRELLALFLQFCTHLHSVTWESIYIW